MAIRIPTDVSLIEGEKPIWFGQMTYAANWPLFLLGLLFFWTIIGLPLFFILAWINVTTSEYFISNKRIYLKHGLIARVALDSKKMDWITNTAIVQDFFGRILNYGNVLIATPGTYIGTSMFKGVEDPMRIKEIIEERIVNYKKVEENRHSLRRITDEFKMGRLDESRYNTLKIEFEQEINKYS
jgi:uncharacterized membrane protein YdbT with pleckstrin-like domain